jgi:hypothetical protein
MSLATTKHLLIIVCVHYFFTGALSRTIRTLITFWSLVKSASVHVPRSALEATHQIESGQLKLVLISDVTFDHTSGNNTSHESKKTICCQSFCELRYLTAGQDESRTSNRLAPQYQGDRIYIPHLFSKFKHNLFNQRNAALTEAFVAV